MPVGDDTGSAGLKTRNEVRSTTLDTVENGTNGDGKDEVKVSLHVAAEEGDMDKVKSLLERGVDVNARDANEQTPLHVAAVKGNVDVVRLLIEQGAEVDPCDKYGWTPLHWSSRQGHLEDSRVLLDYSLCTRKRTLQP